DPQRSRVILITKIPKAPPMLGHRAPCFYCTTRTVPNHRKNAKVSNGLLSTGKRCKNSWEKSWRFIVSNKVGAWVWYCPWCCLLPCVSSWITFAQKCRKQDCF